MINDECTEAKKSRAAIIERDRTLISRLWPILEIEQKKKRCVTKGLFITQS